MGNCNGSEEKPLPRSSPVKQQRTAPEGEGADVIVKETVKRSGPARRPPSGTASERPSRILTSNSVANPSAVHGHPPSTGRASGRGGRRISSVAQLRATLYQRRESILSKVEVPSAGRDVVLYIDPSSVTPGSAPSPLQGLKGTVVSVDGGRPLVKFDHDGPSERLLPEHLLGKRQEVVAFYSEDTEVRFFVSYANELLRWVKPRREPGKPSIQRVQSLSFRHADRMLRDERNVGGPLGKGDWRRVVNSLADACEACGVGHNLPTRVVRVDGWFRPGAAVMALWGTEWHPGGIAEVHTTGEVDVVWDEDSSLTPRVSPVHVRPWMRKGSATASPASSPPASPSSAGAAFALTATASTSLTEIAVTPSLHHSPHLDFNDVYDTGDKLGEGGFGEVYSVVHKATGKAYAAKVLPVSHATKDEAREVATTRREAVVVGSKVQSLNFADLSPDYLELERSNARATGGKTRTVSGFVVYSGPCPFGDEGWVGVVLDVRVGTHNGTVERVKYFDAPSGRGAFVRSADCRLVRPHVAEVWAGLSHPRLCELVDWRAGRHAYTAHGLPDWKNNDVYGPNSENYMVCVMSHSAGGDLESLMKSHRFRHTAVTEESAAHVVRQVLDGLAAMHAHGLLHHDLKISNVLLEDKHTPGEAFFPSVRLCDFGLTRYVGDGEIGGGTLLYMPPELLLAWRWRPNTQWSPQWKEAAARFGVRKNITQEPPSYDQKIDIFAAGVVCYAVLTRGRRHPFHLDGSWTSLPESEHLLKLAQSVLGGVLFPERDWGRISDECKHFISMLLSPDAADRPTAAEALQHPWIVRNTTRSSSPTNPINSFGSTKPTKSSEEGAANPITSPPTSPREDAGSLGLVSKYRGMKVVHPDAAVGPKGPPKGLPHRESWRSGVKPAQQKPAGQKPPAATASKQRVVNRPASPQRSDAARKAVSGAGVVSPVKSSADADAAHCVPIGSYTPKLPPRHAQRVF